MTGAHTCQRHKYLRIAEHLDGPRNADRLVLHDGLMGCLVLSLGRIRLHTNRARTTATQPHRPKRVSKLQNEVESEVSKVSRHYHNKYLCSVYRRDIYLTSAASTTAERAPTSSGSKEQRDANEDYRYKLLHALQAIHEAR